MARSRSSRSAGVGSGRKAIRERPLRGRRGAGNDGPSILTQIDEVVYIVGATEEDPFGGTVELVSDRARQITGHTPRE